MLYKVEKQYFNSIFLCSVDFKFIINDFSCFLKKKLIAHYMLSDGNVVVSTSVKIENYPRKLFTVIIIIIIIIMIEILIQRLCNFNEFILNKKTEKYF